MVSLKKATLNWASFKIVAEKILSFKNLLLNYSCKWDFVNLSFTTQGQF